MSLLFEEKQLNQQVGRVTSFTFIFWDQRDRFDSEKYWESYLFSFLSGLRVMAAVSPVHNKDINEIDVDTGVIEFKHSHWHVVIDFGSGNTKTIKQIFDLLMPIRSFISITPWDKYFDDDKLHDLANDFDISCDLFNSDDDDFKKLKKLWLNANVVRCMRSLLRYFKHLDNPEKYQYEDSITSFGGFEVEDRIYSQSDSLYMIDQILDFIENNQIYSFWKLVRYCQKNNREWFSVLMQNKYSLSLTQALKSFTVENTGYLDKKIEKYENYETTE